jgi:hypothetical protein
VKVSASDQYAQKTARRKAHDCIMNVSIHLLVVAQKSAFHWWRLVAGPQIKEVVFEEATHSLQRPTGE